MEAMESGDALQKFAQFNKLFECLHGDKTHNTVCSNKFTWCFHKQKYYLHNLL
jgi:hypothetical protein